MEELYQSLKHQEQQTREMGKLEMRNALEVLLEVQRQTAGELEQPEATGEQTGEENQGEDDGAADEE